MLLRSFITSFFTVAAFVDIRIAGAEENRTNLPCPLTQSSQVNITPTADLPCEVTGKAPAFSFGTFGGGADNGGVTAQMLLPLNESFFLQTDGVLGLRNGHIFGDVAGHAFMRNEIGQIGAYGSWSAVGRSRDKVQLGAEWEVYLGGLNVSAVLGWQNAGKHNVFLDSRLGYGLTDKTTAYVGYAYDDGGFAKAGIEHDLDILTDGTNGVTLFGQTQITNKSDVSAHLGVRMNFGGGSLNNCLSAPPSKMSTNWKVGKKQAANPAPEVNQCSTLPASVLNGLCRPDCYCSGWSGTYTGADYSGCYAQASACSSS